MANYDHLIYKNDPVLFKSYVNKRCKVTATDKSVHTGIVYTVDPVTESIVLVDDADTLKGLKFIIGHAVRRVEVLSDNVEELPELFHRTSAQNSPVCVTKRKQAVMKILRENRFPIIENNDVIEMENVFSINPPYKSENCVSTFPAVLSSLHKMLSQLT